MTKQLRKARWTLAGLLVLLTLAAAPAWAQNRLTVDISTDRETYRLGEAIPVNFWVDNQTRWTITLDGPACVPVFGLYAFDFNGNLLWYSDQCPSCCCTCCLCVVDMVTRTLRPGTTEFRGDVTWHQERTVDRSLCLCTTGPVAPGYYFLIGQVLDSYSDPILVEIRPE